MVAMSCDSLWRHHMDIPVVELFRSKEDAQDRMDVLCRQGLNVRLEYLDDWWIVEWMQ